MGKIEVEYVTGAGETIVYNYDWKVSDRKAKRRKCPDCYEYLFILHLSTPHKGVPIYFCKRCEKFFSFGGIRKFFLRLLIKLIGFTWRGVERVSVNKK